MIDFEIILEMYLINLFLFRLEKHIYNYLYFSTHLEHQLIVLQMLKYQYHLEFLYKMSNDSAPLTDITRKLRVEQTVRDFLEILDQNELDLEEGLVAWNMLGFTIFQDLHPDESHDQTHQRMIEFSRQLFESRARS